jgi:excinuclease ABC subunit C
MQELFQLTHFPSKIECFDNSHLAGTSIVSSMVSFLNGEKHKAGYRKFTIRSLTTPDDYAILREALHRRYRHAKQVNALPDLLIIDGGKGHYHIALDVLSTLDIISVNVIAISKEAGRHDKGLTQEQVHYQSGSPPLILERHHPILLFLQTIRDEAHRFAIAFHQKRRSKAIIKSALDDIPGIGPIKKKRLLQAFGSVKSICQKRIDELLQVPGITQKDAQTIQEFFQRPS